MTLSDLLYLCALLAVIAGVAILVAVFLGLWASIGAGFIALGCSLFRASYAFDAKDSS